MSKLPPFDLALRDVNNDALHAPPGAIDAAVEVFRALKLSRAALTDVFDKDPTPEQTIAVMQAMLRQAIARTS